MPKVKSQKEDSSEHSENTTEGAIPDFEPLQCVNDFDGSSGSHGGFSAPEAGDGELPPNPSDSGNGNTGNVGDGEVPKKRRGRKPNSASRPSEGSGGGKWAGLRGQLVDIGGGCVMWGASAYGNYRGNRYKKTLPILVGPVADCHKVGSDAAEMVGSAFADCVITSCPDAVLKKTEKLSPFVNLGLCLARLLDEGHRREARIVEDVKRMLETQKERQGDGDIVEAVATIGN